MGERQRVALVCEECGARNYKKTKPLAAAMAPSGPGERAVVRLTLKKYCPHCKRHTVHRESK